jgi:hypothetical protein
MHAVESGKKAAIQKNRFEKAVSFVLFGTARCLMLLITRCIS